MINGIVISDIRKHPSVKNIIDEFIKQTSSKEIIYDSYNETNTIVSDIKEAIKEDDYDFIATWYDTVTISKIKPLHEFGLPVISATGDCWNRLFDNYCKSFINKIGADIIMVVNKCTIPAFRDYLDNDDIDIVWGADGIDPTIMKDYKENKIYDVGYSGKFSNYSDRKEISNYLIRNNNRQKISYKKFKRTPEWIDYAKNLNKSWISYSSVQNVHFLYYKDIYIGNCFGKTLEIPACNTALIMRKFGDADVMGYKDGENCIFFDKIKEFPKKLSYYLDDKELLSKVTKKGYELVHKKHTIGIHTTNLLNDIKKVL